MKGWEGGLRCRIAVRGELEIIWIVASSNMAEMASISSVRAVFEVVVEDIEELAGKRKSRSRSLSSSWRMNRSDDPSSPAPYFLWRNIKDILSIVD